jgi:hypothetical protein
VNKTFSGVCAAILFLPVVAQGAASDGQITGYLANPIIDYGSIYANSGTGLGLRGWARVHPNWLLHGEYQTTEMEETKTKVDSLRLGAGFVRDLGGAAMWLVKGEYVDFGPDLEQAGFGVHGGVMLQSDSALSWSGTLGYLSTDDTDGLEINVGAHYAFNPKWGAVLDYRNYMGNADPSGDFDLSEFRLGGTFTFD